MPLLLTLLSLALQAENSPTEPQKIEALITHIEKLENAKFIQSGTEYDAKTAGQFLRSKWKSNEASIKSAADFIEKAASLSSTTGQPYLIKFSDGLEFKSAEYLTAELKELESPK